MYKNIKSKKGYNINIKEIIPDFVEDIVVAIHGFTGDKESSAILKLAETLNKQNIGVIALDLPGHGTSEVDGDFLTINNCINDINEVINYAKEKYNLKQLSIFATSFGGYLAITLINRYKNNFNKIILRCPAIKMDEILIKEIVDDTNVFKNKGYIIAGYERKLKVNYSLYEELLNNKLTTLNTLGYNILIIHGDADTTAPTTDAINFAKHNNLKINLVKNADHRFKKPGELETVIELAIEFINK